MDEAGLPRESSPMRRDLAVPQATLEALRLQPKRADAYALPLVNGKLTKTSAVQGHFHRLTPESATALDALIAAPPPTGPREPTTKKRARRRAE